jgi:hypothetical protein
MLNMARRAGLAVAAVGIANEFFLYDGKNSQNNSYDSYEYDNLYVAY